MENKVIEQARIKRERDLLFACLVEVLDGNTPKELQNWTGLNIERCEQIFDIYYRLLDGKTI